MKTMTTRKGQTVQEPAFVNKLLNSPAAGWLWLPLRLWLGWRWFDAALKKIDNLAWIETGAALQGFWSRIVVVPDEGHPAIAFDWYRDFIQLLLNAEAYVWFGKLVASGELLAGAALIIGAFTGIAAFFGAIMNWNFMMAGSASTNPLLFVVAVLLILAWKVSGYIGADAYLLRWLGTPWKGEQPKEVLEPVTA